MISVYDRTVHIVGKGENGVYQHFILFPQCFQRASEGLLKVWIVLKSVKLLLQITYSVSQCIKDKFNNLNNSNNVISKCKYVCMLL